jgi:hypothetical protein
MKKIVAILYLVLAVLVFPCGAGTSGGSWIVSGSKTTDEFSATDTWKIRWDLVSTEHGTTWMYIAVHDKATGSVVDNVRAKEPGPGETVVYHAGQFYLDISVVGKAKIWIE